MTEEQYAELISLLSDIKQIGMYLIGSIMFVAGMLPIPIFFGGKKGK